MVQLECVEWCGNRLVRALRPLRRTPTVISETPVLVNTSFSLEVRKLETWTGI